MDHEKSVLQQARAAYKPRLPFALRQGRTAVIYGASTEAVSDQDEIRKLFPSTYGQREVTLAQSDGELNARALRMGVVLSGGPAAGGHNVIAGLFDALQTIDTGSRLFGFLRGPSGIVRGESREITSDVVDAHRNTGGFEMIMTGREKIEKPDELARCTQHLTEMGLDGLVIVGGDDSNTNAAVLAEYLRSHGSATCVVGVPKTVDGDMRNRDIATTFGYDTACKVYAHIIGNICRDAVSAGKYWHFVRLMGRSASHVALECALQTHPNLVLISEEVQRSGTTLDEIVDNIVKLIVTRAAGGKDHGVIVLPEGLPEFISDTRTMIDELSAILGKEEDYIHSLPDHSERVQYLSGQFTDHSARVYNSLPEDAQEALLRRDSHGNVPLSQIETERLLIDLVSDKIRLLNAHRDKPVKFSPLSHFLGYEGRCAPPSNFDADYSYSLGFAAAHLVLGGLSGYTVHIRNLAKSPDEWIAGGTPITSMLCIEKRKGREKPVIRKAVVDLDGLPFQTLAANRERWATEDCYVHPGPIQYFGPPEVCDAPPIILTLEAGEHANRSQRSGQDL